MKVVKTFLIILIMIPVLGYSQLKKDTEKVNISNTLQSGAQNSLIGFLDPAKFDMQHSFSVSINYPILLIR